MVFRSSFVRSKMSELAVETDKRCTDLPTLNFSLRPMMNTTLGSQPMTSQLSLRSTLEIWAAQAADAEVPGGTGGRGQSGVQHRRDIFSVVLFF